MYGAGWAAWAQAARLADGTYVTSTAMVWLGGHFGVTAAQAGLYVWKSKDSYTWEFASRAAAVADMPGFPAWFGPCEGPNEHDSESGHAFPSSGSDCCNKLLSGSAGRRQDPDDCHPDRRRRWRPTVLPRHAHPEELPLCLQHRRWTYMEPAARDA
jgi:hypothetical protein